MSSTILIIVIDIRLQQYYLSVQCRQHTEARALTSVHQLVAHGPAAAHQTIPSGFQNCKE